MGKRPVLTKGTRLFSWVTKCTVITAHPDLTGIYNNNILNLVFSFYCLVNVDVHTDVVII